LRACLENRRFKQAVAFEPYWVAPAPQNFSLPGGRGIIPCNGYRKVFCFFFSKKKRFLCILQRNTNLHKNFFQFYVENLTSI